MTDQTKILSDDVIALINAYAEENIRMSGEHWPRAGQPKSRDQLSRESKKTITHISKAQAAYDILKLCGCYT